MRVELKRVKLTDRFVKSATTDGRNSPIFMDDEVIVFGVQVGETGRKASPSTKYSKDAVCGCTGDFPDWPTNAARTHRGPYSICCVA